MMTLYQQIRAAGKSMHGKALEATRHLDFHPARIAKAMTLPTSGKLLICDGEVAQNAFFDFWMNEYQVHGKSMAESVDPVAAGFDALETEILQAHRGARTSFFQTASVFPGEHVVVLKDLLAPEHPETRLMDIGLSESISRLGLRLALFCRLLHVRGITMTSGFSFGFEPERVPGILEAHRQKMKRVPAAELATARFVFFFQKHRQIGVDQEYRDVN